MTALTLASFRSSAGFQSLRHLRLQELALHDCPDAELQLFLPGSFSALRRVSIEEPVSEMETFGANIDLHDPAAEHKAEQLAQAARDLLSLPSLRFLSGHCKLFMVGRVGEQEGWSRNPSSSRGHYCSQTDTRVKTLCFYCLHGYQEWTKTI